jgi:hypothetical protein
VSPARPSPRREAEAVAGSPAPVKRAVIGRIRLTRVAIRIEALGAMLTAEAPRADSERRRA